MPNYVVGRFFYDFLFFLIIAVIMLNIIFGIIIDTFAELRELNQKIQDDKNNVCYVCGAKRDDFNKGNKNFDEHVGEEHCIWNYVEYMIGLKFVDVQDTNAINSYVIDMINEKNISWLPIYAEEKKMEEND